MVDTETPEGRRGKRAAVRAFLGVVGLGVAYAVFNYRISQKDLERRGRGRRTRRP